MPAYHWLNETPLQVDDLGAHLAILPNLGMPNADAMIAKTTYEAPAPATPKPDRAARVRERQAWPQTSDVLSVRPK